MSISISKDVKESDTVKLYLVEETVKSCDINEYWIVANNPEEAIEEATYDDEPYNECVSEPWREYDYRIAEVKEVKS